MFSSIVFKTFQTLQFSKFACHAIKDNNKDVIKQAGEPALQKKPRVENFDSQSLGRKTCFNYF